MRDCARRSRAPAAALELVHFGCTSEDINNLSYARLLPARAREVLLPELRRARCAPCARWPASTPSCRCSRAPTGSPRARPPSARRWPTSGRAWRARGAGSQAVEILAKWNGAVGNYNAHQVARPEIDWIALSRRSSSTRSSSTCNPYSTQIEPHDWIAEYCDACAAINVILIDLCRDLWGYISLGYLRQRAVAGEVGSSTMPHKVNPIDFENAEGNLGMANAMLRFFAEKLPISRWQRDLTDSTVLRNLGVALAHTLDRLEGAAARAGQAHPPMRSAWRRISRAPMTPSAEAVQSVLRAAGVANGYELLRDFTRGQSVDAAGAARPDRAPCRCRRPSAPGSRR